MNPLLKNMTTCPKCHQLYPSRFDKSPMCHADAVSTSKPLSQEQIERATQISLVRGDLRESQIE